MRDRRRARLLTVGASAAAVVCALSACLVSIPDLAPSGDAGDAAACDADLSQDPSNCGACGKVCDPGGVCVNRACVSRKVLATVGHAQFLALSAPYLYVSQRTPPQVLRADLRAPDRPPELVAKLPSPATAMAIWRGQILFIVGGELQTALGDAGTITSKGAGGGLSSLSPGGDRLYLGAGGREIAECSAFDCQPRVAMPGSQGAKLVEATGAQLFFVQNERLKGCALDGGCRATTDYAHSGGPIASLAALGDEPWLGTAAGSVERGRADASTDPVVRVDGAVAAMRMDDRYVWLVAGSRLLRVPRGASSSEVVLDGLGGPSDVALGDGVVYVAAEDGGVLQAPR